MVIYVYMYIYLPMYIYIYICMIKLHCVADMASVGSNQDNNKTTCFFPIRPIGTRQDYRACDILPFIILSVLLGRLLWGL